MSRPEEEGSEPRDSLRRRSKGATAAALARRSVGGGGGGGVMVPHQQDELPRPQQQYTIPGILHYIQHEWARFEMERAHWEVERAELQGLSTHCLPCCDSLGSGCLQHDAGPDKQRTLRRR
ncbi:striatin-4 [Etheostoma spectabile]|uniref:striatin-4 n=1 Tax=Etheostoma spectabile TaxID=54343 RepID=UPI0013AEB4AA|nr:striatin-4-like [Etheostoma spectabile]